MSHVTCTLSLLFGIVYMVINQIIPFFLKMVLV